MDAERIKRIREKMGLPQWRFAERIGVRQATVSRLESGVMRPSGPLEKLLAQLEAQVAAQPAGALPQ